MHMFMGKTPRGSPPSNWHEEDMPLRLHFSAAEALSFARLLVKEARRVHRRNLGSLDVWCHSATEKDSLRIVSSWQGAPMKPGTKKKAAGAGK